MELILKGIRILDFSLLEQGPYCSQMLGDMGAEVIKVEPVKTGERGRHVGTVFLNGVGAYFLALNRNKKSITVNLKTNEGKEIVRKLAKRCDVVLQNFRPKVMERLGLDYKGLSELNPSIIYCSLSGYGQTGPYRERIGQDLISQGMGGLMSLTGEAGGPPVPVGTYVVDAYAASLAAFGIMVALFYRERTGIGQEVEVCLLDATISLHCQEATAYLNTGRVPKRGGRGVAHALEPPPYGAYKTKDIYISIVGPLSKVLQILGLKHLEEDPRFNSDRKRFENREKLHSILEDALKEKTGKEWLELFTQEHVWCGPILRYEQVFVDPQVLHNETIIQFKHPIAGQVKTVGIPVKLKKTAGKIQSPPPTLGQHTEPILSSLGYARKDIEELKRKGIV